MSGHVSYRGTMIDMDALRRENDSVIALGNMNVNARGDKLSSGSTVARSADDIARENHRVKSAVLMTGLKGVLPSDNDVSTSVPKELVSKQSEKKVKPREKELPTGDIVVDEE